MVEDDSTTTTTTITPAPPKYLDEKVDPLNETVVEEVYDVEVSVAHTKPITACIRTATRHLHAVGGRHGNWRGLGASICINFFLWAMHYNLNTVARLMDVGGPASVFVINILCAVLYSRMHATWTHIVISPPSSLRWWRRIPGGNRPAQALALPAVAVVLAEYAMVGLPTYMHAQFGPLPDYEKDTVISHAQLINEMCRLVATVTLAASLFIAVWMPANVALTRVEASLLPADVDTIVSFDRSLDGVVPAVDEPMKYMAWYAAAWRTFDRPARRRLLKLYVKMAMLTLALCIFFGVLLSAQVSVIGPEKLSALADKIMQLIDESGFPGRQTPIMVQQL